MIYILGAPGYIGNRKHGIARNAKHFRCIGGQGGITPNLRSACNFFRGHAATRTRFGMSRAGRGYNSNGSHVEESSRRNHAREG